MAPASKKGSAQLLQCQHTDGSEVRMRVPIIIEPSLPSPTDSLVYTKLRSARSRRAGAHHPDGAGRRVLHHQHPWRGVWRAQSKGSPGAHCGLGSNEAGGGLPRQLAGDYDARDGGDVRAHARKRLCSLAII